jgi:hypothetical protein
VYNYAIPNKRGEFTREAIRDLLACLTYARETNILYCGISKAVQLRVYSGVLDWYISKYINKNWDIDGYVATDGQAMSLLLAAPDFVLGNLNSVLSTCFVRRTFTTRANLNTHVPAAGVQKYLDNFQRDHDTWDITPYRKLCDIFIVYMFFIGYSKNPQQLLPRYEFFHYPELGPPAEIGQRLLAAIRRCSLTADLDHSFLSDTPICYLLPSVTYHAHELSKSVGKYIDSATGQAIMARYAKLALKALKR